jgi:hypothetical protein
VARAGDRRSHISIRDPRLAYAIVQRANHLMMEIAHETMDDASPAQVATEQPQSPAYFMLLASWLEKTLATGSAVPGGK